MILSFSHPVFENLIRQGVKTFTVREDKHNRWRSGMKIHFWKNSPRNPSKNPFPFGEGICNSVEYCFLSPRKNIVKLSDINSPTDILLIDNIEMLNSFAVEDGFKNWENLKEFFNEEFEGKLIRWDYSKCHFF